MSAASTGKQIPKMFISSLSIVGANYTERCDAKIADASLLKIEADIRKNGSLIWVTSSPIRSPRAYSRSI